MTRQKLTFALCGGQVLFASAILAIPRAEEGSRRINVTDTHYGADPSGKSDSTLAIREAVKEACQNRGGVIYFPSGTYKVSIQLPNEIAAIPIGCDNITIEGKDINRSIISVYGYGDRDPDTTCPAFPTPDGGLAISQSKPNSWITGGNKPTVNRGSGFWVYGTRANVHFRNIRITGNRIAYANMKANGFAYPATEANCFNIWDISDKGIAFQPDLTHDRCSIENVRVDHWSGELFYFGYGDTRKTGGLVTIVGSEFDHGTSDGVSTSSQLVAKGNNFHDLGAQAIENSSYADVQIIQNNTIADVAQGIVVTNFGVQQRGGSFDIGGNTLRNVSRTGIMIGAQNVHVHDNTLTDFAFDRKGLWAGIGIFNNTKGYCPTNPQICMAKNVSIDHNNLYADKENCGAAIIAVAGDYGSAENISIEDNVAELTPFAREHGTSLQKGIDLAGNIINLTEERNRAIGTRYCNTDQMSASNIEIRTTPMTIVKLRPVRERQFGIEATLNISSRTTVKATWSWFDRSGTEQLRDAFPSTTYSPGSYRNARSIIVAQGATESQYIKLTVIAGEPKSATVSAAIVEEPNSNRSNGKP